MHRFSHLEEMTNVVFLLFPGSQSRNLDLIKHPESQGYWDLFNEKKGERESNIIPSKGPNLAHFQTKPRTSR